MAGVEAINYIPQLELAEAFSQRQIEKAHKFAARWGWAYPDSAYIVHDSIVLDPSRVVDQDALRQWAAEVNETFGWSYGND